MRIKQDQLDFLRGVAATYVVINHSRGRFFIGGDNLLATAPTVFNKLVVMLLQATSLGAEVVILFFVLSGFAMAHSVSRSRSVPMFYLKRVIRIWPPYIAAALLAFAVGSVVGVRVRLLPMIFYSHVATKVTSQFWSLPYEVVFYALCPLVLSKRTIWFAGLAALGAAATVALRGIGLNPWHSLLANFAGNEALFFACGALAYHFIDRVPVVGNRTLAVIDAGALLLTVALKVWLGGPNMACHAVVIAATVLTIKNLPPMPKWANFGSFSYSIYIFHFALLALAVWACGRFGIDAAHITNPFVWMLVPAPVIGLCYLLYLVTEKPCNRIVLRLRRVAVDDGAAELMPLADTPERVPAGLAGGSSVDVELQAGRIRDELGRNVGLRRAD